MTDARDQNHKPVWIGAAIGGVLFFPAFFLAYGDAAGGHGNYYYARIFFPLWTYLVALFNLGHAAKSPSMVSVLELLVYATSLVQFPAYGAFLGRAWKRDTVLRSCVLLAALHTVAVLVGFFYESDMPWW